jgi:DNA-binding IclR family transcriptional regulator
MTVETIVSDGESSLAKMLHILQLFTEERPEWSTASIIEAMSTSRSTGYRYIKILHDAGLLSSVRNGHYSLGPRIIEMDLQIRSTDPLLLASHGVLEDLVQEIGHSALICTSYRDAVLCIAEQRGPLSPSNRFSRGQRRPLFQGAVSKVILAHLPHHRLKALFAQHEGEIERASLGSTWSEFRASLAEIRKDGYALTTGEFNPGVNSVAAPVFGDQNAVLGSVGVAWDSKQRQDVDVDRAAQAVKLAAETISARLDARAKT